MQIEAFFGKKWSEYPEGTEPILIPKGTTPGGYSGHT